MPRAPRYDVLFEPVQIGPVTAKNRFYQVPHCSGMGYMLPQTLAAMRAVKEILGLREHCFNVTRFIPYVDLTAIYAGIAQRNNQVMWALAKTVDGELAVWIRHRAPVGDATNPIHCMDPVE